MTLLHNQLDLDLIILVNYWQNYVKLLVSLLTVLAIMNFKDPWHFL